MNQCEVAAGKDSELDRFTLKSILIVEEEFRIALDLQDTLVRAGYSDTNLCTSRAEALRSLSIRTPTVALLDVQLMDGSSADIAMERETRGVPFIVCSGLEKSDVPEIFLRARWLSKPCVETELLTAVLKALNGRNHDGGFAAKTKSRTTGPTVDRSRRFRTNERAGDFIEQWREGERLKTQALRLARLAQQGGNALLCRIHHQADGALLRRFLAPFGFMSAVSPRNWTRKNT